ncbi:aspartate/glutamate racemase family protein [Ancylobacter sp. A5.8]|uniref:aspartate/glutamate racemase family protein n=1 Tax=Ancylobacter gelatini TaxID=2919920 RepID=UPI001F4E9575|nr:aspartate/glutamate racemase family protein [Ancylobacter gelatini]MCJ8142299.1 aspartate/glutamate racemase family protein [Ancylobacter gelatini]
MRILILNPNTTEAITALLEHAAAGAAAPGTEFITATAPRGFPYISTKAEAQISGAIALEVLAECHREVDAAIIAAFGDPGLFAARELFDIPVVGMSEAAMLTACMLGQRFAIVTFAEALGSWYRDCVAMHGMAERCAGIRFSDQPFSTLATVQEEKEERLVALALQAVEEDGAEVVILSGAPLAGLAPKVADRIPVPVIDPIAAAVKQVETLVALAPRKPTVGAFRRPAAKSTLGLDPALAMLFEHRDVPRAAE